MSDEDIYKKRIDKIDEIEKTILENNQVLPFLHDARMHSAFMQQCANRMTGRIDFRPNSDIDNQIATVYGVVKKYDKAMFSSISANATGEAVGFVRALGNWAVVTPAEVVQKREITEAYKKLKDDDFHIKETRRFLGDYFPVLAQEYEEAVTAYKSYRHDESQRQNIAIKLRTFMEHLKGKIWDKVEDKKGGVSWERIAEELAKNGPGSAEYNSIRDKGRDWDYLHKELTNMSKANEIKNHVDIDAVFKTWVNFNYSVLFLLDEEKVKI